MTVEEHCEAGVCSCSKLVVEWQAAEMQRKQGRRQVATARRKGRLCPKGNIGRFPVVCKDSLKAVSDLEFKPVLGPPRWTTA
jgi:hypothetical protein